MMTDKKDDEVQLTLSGDDLRGLAYLAHRGFIDLAVQNHQSDSNWDTPIEYFERWSAIIEMAENTAGRSALDIEFVNLDDTFGSEFSRQQKIQHVREWRKSHPEQEKSDEDPTI